MRENSDAQFAPITRMFLERQRTDVNEGDTYRFGLPLRQFHTTNGFYCYISDSLFLTRASLHSTLTSA
jgi:hypothetical protein